jgi:nitroimidazol reductase NimA-like FMN-containing flavoprotein (pyridoxamine 5'-phosphate oxidase superfamily)
MAYSDADMDLDGAVGARHMVELSRAEALGLLGGASFGRIVFTRDALPAIRPVNHVLDDGDIVIRTHEAAALSLTSRQTGADPAVAGVVVAYEADDIDPNSHLGWSVVVTGYARLITAPELVERYRGLLRSWGAQPTDYAVRIRPDLVTGYRLVAKV